jgi:hypothetical protein
MPLLVRADKKVRRGSAGQMAKWERLGLGANKARTGRPATEVSPALKAIRAGKGWLGLKARPVSLAKPASKASKARKVHPAHKARLERLEGLASKAKKASKDPPANAALLMPGSW